MKILNAYCGVGGNRSLWGDTHQITAVELNKDIAEIYSKIYPQDEIIVEDAHNYLLNNFEKYDFIWTSPPCTSHSKMNSYLSKQGFLRYPDMSLYQEIILLMNNFKGFYCVENVISYYEPLIKPVQIGRHFFWTNFKINKNFQETKKINIEKANLKDLEQFYNIDLSFSKLSYVQKRQILRNICSPETALHILEKAQNQESQIKQTQLDLFSNTQEPCFFS